MADKLVSFLLSEGMSPLVDNQNSNTIIIVLVLAQVISFLCILFVKGKSLIHNRGVHTRHYRR